MSISKIGYTVSSVFAAAALSLATTANAVPVLAAFGKVPDPASQSELPPPTIDSNQDGKVDAWDRDANGVTDAWDVNGDNKPDQFDNDGDGKPDPEGDKTKPDKQPI
ncbi:MAG: hypothetical protein WBO17_08850 [Sphingorhabdus sp.]